MTSTAVARAEQPKVPRVLIIMMEKQPSFEFPQVKGLRDRLGELGYLRGKISPMIYYEKKRMMRFALLLKPSIKRPM